MSEITQVITSVGFPIAMCLWFMFRTERVVKDNTEALKELKIELRKKGD